METESASALPRGKHGTKRDPNRKRGQRLSVLETVDILSLHKKGISHSEIARAMGMSVQRVSEKIRAYSSTTETALSVLQANSHLAAEEWIKTFSAARKRGEHRPMKDVLVAVGVISPDPINQGVTVVIGAGDAGVMLQTHSSSSHAPNTLPATSHNALPDLLIPHEPL